MNSKKYLELAIKTRKEDMLAWIDIETTGLTLDCQLLSIACIITDVN